MNDRCIHGLESLPASVRGCVLTIGNFDGVHIGHQRILQTARSLGDQEGAAVVAMTFDPPPDLVLRPHDAPHRITPSKERIRLLLECGSDRVVSVLTDKQFLTTTPQDFIENILVARFAPKHVVEGQNFFFGHKRSGNVETLAEASDRGGFRLHVVDPVMLELGDDPTRISSTLIRSLILTGQIVDVDVGRWRDFGNGTRNRLPSPMTQFASTRPNDLRFHEPLQVPFPIPYRPADADHGKVFSVHEPLGECLRL